MEFNNPQSTLKIKEGYFENNIADMGGCLILNQPTGSVYVDKSIFLANFGFTEFRVYIGSGSVLQSAGTSTTMIYLSRNLIALNEAEYKGYN